MNTRIRAELFLFGTTFIWGSTFVIVKLGLEDVSPLLLVAIRFSIASLLFLPFCWQPLFQMDRALFLNGCWLGFLIFLGFAAQTVGLQYTSALLKGEELGATDYVIKGCEAEALLKHIHRYI